MFLASTLLQEEGRFVIRRIFTGWLTVPGLLLHDPPGKVAQQYPPGSVAPAGIVLGITDRL